MALTTSAWDRPIQGVSQQPPKVRLGGQCTTQENAISSVVSGLIKRPGTVRIGTLADAFPDNTAYYYYNRGTNEEYVVVVPPGGPIRVFDILGDELTVEVQHPNPTYATPVNPQSLRFSTISDFTFIVNTDIIPKASSTDTASLENKAIINVQFADYGRKYIVYLDGQMVVTYLAPDGSESSHIVWVATDTVAEILMKGDSYEAETNSTAPTSAQIVGPGLENVSGYTVTRNASSIIVAKNDSTNFEVSTTDGADGRDLYVVKNMVKEVSDLPLYAPEGYRVEVVGSGNTNDDNYWLEAESISGDTVRWVESTGPSQSVGFDKLTMPSVLIRDRFENGKAVFVLDEGPWVDRDVGDDTSNPFPSFIQDEEPIRSVGTFQNRLFFTAGESVIYSRSNRFFDFFRETVRTSLDDDPIDVYADTNQVNILENSAVLDGDVVFFSQNGQFLQRGNNPVTKDNATLLYASTFDNTASCQPVAGGDVIFFAFEYGRFAGIREFYTDSFTDTKRARPVTDHVDEYIVGTAKRMSVSTNRNQLIVLADNEDELYVYNWLWQGQERVQSSWSRWKFDGKVKFFQYDNETLYILIERNGKLELEYIETGVPDDNGLTFAARLDRRFEATATRQNGQWRLNVPYNVTSDELVLVQGEGCTDPGVTIAWDKTGSLVTTSEDIGPPDATEVKVIGGIRFNMIYEPTMPFIRDRNGRVIDTDRLILNDVFVNYDATGFFTVIVENEWGNTREYEFNGRVLGSVNNLVGFAPLVPGQFKFPVRQEADRVVFRIETASHLPFQLRDMEWRGRFHQRGRRV